MIALWLPTQKLLSFDVKLVIVFSEGDTCLLTNSAVFQKKQIHGCIQMYIKITEKAPVSVFYASSQVSSLGHGDSLL